jgi:hypothetical protein
MDFDHQGLLLPQCENALGLGPFFTFWLELEVKVPHDLSQNKTHFVHCHVLTNTKKESVGYHRQEKMIRRAEMVKKGVLPVPGTSRKWLASTTMIIGKFLWYRLDPSLRFKGIRACEIERRVVS